MECCLFSFFKICICAHKYLPRTAVTREYASNVNFTCWHYSTCKISISTGAYNKMPLAINITVNAITVVFLRFGGKSPRAISLGERNAAHGHQLSAEDMGQKDEKEIPTCSRHGHTEERKRTYPAYYVLYR